MTTTKLNQISGRTKNPLEKSIMLNSGLANPLKKPVMPTLTTISDVVEITTGGGDFYYKPHSSFSFMPHLCIHHR